MFLLIYFFPCYTVCCATVPVLSKQTVLSCHTVLTDLCECQESRIGKAVEVMIQHVENLRRMYTKEHTELLELRETLMQNERSFGSHIERGGTCRDKLSRFNSFIQFYQLATTFSF